MRNCPIFLSTLQITYAHTSSICRHSTIDNTHTNSSTPHSAEWLSRIPIAFTNPRYLNLCAVALLLYTTQAKEFSRKSHYIESANCNVLYNTNYLLAKNEENNNNNNNESIRIAMFCVSNIQLFSVCNNRIGMNAMKRSFACAECERIGGWFRDRIARMIDGCERTPLPHHIISTGN